MSMESTFLGMVIPELDRLLTRVAAAETGARPGSGYLGVLVALSGGADSVALLLAAAARRTRVGEPVAAAHVNHMLRGEQADRDEDFCTELCRHLDVPLHVHHADPDSLGAQNGTGLEDAARRLRRRHFAAVLDAEPRLAGCATGHHRDDQLETLIMRFFRGAGAEGMRGIRPVAGRTIHPLLVTDRAEIEAFLTECGQTWRSDPTNADGSNARGRVRHELLPVARSIFGEAAAGAPVRLAQLLADDVAVLEQTAGDLLAGLLATGDGESLPVDVLTEMSQPLASRLVRMHLREYCGVETDLARTHVVRLLEWLPESRSGSGVDLIDGWRACRDFDHLVFVPPEGADEDSPAAALTLRIREATVDEIACPEPEPGLPASATRAWRLTLPTTALHGEPRLRGWRPGDRIVPFGMSGRKKVSDLLRESEVPVRARRDVVLVEDDAGPLWLVGLVRAERTRLLPSTATAVTLLVRGLDADGARDE